ncbi:MAG TPA: ATP-dependent acyl-CoA ligase [Acidimicrobiaceae bacterium]|nr:ATP-dependent acyl-CoA ligase [Acidimicrobiaceae bacterium]
MRGHPKLDDLGPALPRERWTLVEAVRHQARAQGEREFLSFENGERLSFAEFDRLTDCLATALADLGLTAGDRILGLLTNSKEFMITMIATHKLRAVFVPVNTELRGGFLEHQIINSSPRMIVVDDNLMGRFSSFDPSETGIETVVGVGDESSPDISKLGLLAEVSQVRMDSLLDTTPNTEKLADPSPSDVCTIMYTSGTTGPSKGVLMPQGHCYLFALGIVAAMELTEQDRYFCCMPLFHANGLFMQVYASLLAGSSCHVTKRFSVTDWLNIVREENVTVTNALGVMPEFIFRSPPSPSDRDHKMTRILAIPVAEEWGVAMQERFGVKLRQGFGMTEVNMVAYSDLDDPVMSGCAGPPLSDFFEVIIADPDSDVELPRDQVGEILVRPKIPFCFNVGYFKMPDKTVEAWRNLWFHTGDAGRMDSEGRLFFVDRIKDRIRRRGENISSYELEQTLNEYPGVIESAAVGLRVPGAGGEDEIKAVIAINGPSPDPEAFLDWCVPRMPRHTVPRYLEFVAELDKTASGKIRKQAIRDAGVTENTWDRESIGYVISRS